MDSLTQAVLGATVGYAVGGKQLGRKAALWGIGLGTLPDLDVLVQHVDPIDSFVKHRSWSHSLLLTSLAAVPFGLLINRLHKEAGTVPVRMIVMTFLIFFTHIMLDSMTTYGTQIFWFLSDLIPALPQEPIGVGSVSIIDPLYTLPLLVATIWIFVRGRERPDGRATVAGKITAVALILSTLYLGWGMMAQNIIRQQVIEHMAAQDIEVDRMFLTPTIGNSVLWYILVQDDDRVYYGLRSLLEEKSAPLVLQVENRNSAALGAIPNSEHAEKVMAFSKGFYRFEEKNGRVSIADMRMGFPPDYAFNFALANQQGKDKKQVALVPTVHERGQFDQRLFSYLWARIFDAQAATP